MTRRLALTAAATVLIAGVLALLDASGSAERLASFLCGAIAAALGVAIGSAILKLMGRWKGVLPSVICSAVAGVIATLVGFLAAGLVLLPMWAAIVGKRFVGSEAEALGKTVNVITASTLICAVAGLLFGAGLGQSNKPAIGAERNPRQNP